MFKKGDPKPLGSGRKKGQVSKPKQLKVAELLASKGIEPIEEVLKLMPQLSPKDQAKTWMEILSYAQPKPREDAQSLQAQLVQVVQQLPPDWQKAIEAGEPIPQSKAEDDKLFGYMLETAPEEWVYAYMQGQEPPQLTLAEPTKKKEN